MSAAAATDATVTAKGGGGKKKLIIIGAVLALLLAAGGGATVFMMKKRAAAAAEEAAEADDAAPAKGKDSAKPVRADTKSAPTFAPLEPFTVNLADREAERYAQVGITLELADPSAAELLKAYLPAIRNKILLTLSSKTAAQMMEHEGKLALAHEIRAAALAPLGWDLPPAVTTAASAPASAPKAKPKAEPAAAEEPPIRAVHFSNFIIQ